MFDDPSLLVVDDEKVVCEGCRRIFSRQGFRVDESRDPFQGLSMATEKDYAAILLDIKMPAMDGVQFLEKLRERKPSVPVILITGYPSTSSAASAVRLDASDYVTKPFTPEVITKAVQRVIARRDTKAEEEASSVSPGVELWAPRAGEFRFWDESWFRLGKEGSVRAGAMHQRMPAIPMPFEGSMRVGAVLTSSQVATVEAVRLPQVGEAVYQGLPLAGLTIGSKSLRAVPSPLSGVVVAVNPLLRESVWALWEDPCGDGWIACISPTRFEEDVKNCKLRRVVLANAYQLSARTQCEDLTRLGCQVRVVESWEELAPAVEDPNHNVLLFDADSLGEHGPELVGRVNATAPEMKIVVVASSASQQEAAYRQHKISYYAVEPFANNEIVEILDAVFRPQRQPVPPVEHRKASSRSVSSICVTNRSGKRVRLLAASGLLRQDQGLGWHVTHKLLDQLYPVETTLGKGNISQINMMRAATTCDRLLILLARDTGRLPGSLVRDTKGKFVPVLGDNARRVMALVVQPRSPDGGLAGLDDRTTAALADHIVSEMASC